MHAKFSSNDCCALRKNCAHAVNEHCKNQTIRYLFAHASMCNKNNKMQEYSVTCVAQLKHKCVRWKSSANYCCKNISQIKKRKFSAKEGKFSAKSIRE